MGNEGVLGDPLPHTGDHPFHELRWGLRTDFDHEPLVGGCHFGVGGVDGGDEVEQPLQHDLDEFGKVLGPVHAVDEGIDASPVPRGERSVPSHRSILRHMTY